MSPARKLFIAAILVVTGLGVARFLGEPDSLNRALRNALLATPKDPLVAGSLDSAAPSNPAATFAPGSVRLLPVPNVSDSTKSADVARAAPALVAVATPTAPNTLPVSLTPEVNQQISSLGPASFSPRAKLRDEAPRPIGVEPRSAAVVRRMPPIGTAADVPAGCLPAPIQVGFASNQPSTAAIQASFNPPSQGFDGPGPVAPPPWPAPDEEVGPRKHIIVDGDSLAKLAERYLHDSRRGNEIFEINRDRLSSPDLLPIGAELTIPNHSSGLGFIREGGIGLTARNATGSSLTPVQPIPLSTGIAPRAQLARPLSVE